MKVLFNLETGKYEEVKPPKRPICCVPGCKKETHNKVGGGEYKPRVNTAFRLRFGGSGHLCWKHHGEWIKMQHGAKSLDEVTVKNKLEKEERKGKGVLLGY
tara:strand:- start:10604 stop:10906 length:303 start_codon:yes stop_codon:yes gene_type:complete